MPGKWYFFLVVWLSAIPSAVGGEQLSVPSVSYGTIQSAIESANPGDEVVVAPGLYTENLNFRGNAITVRSEDPDDPNVVAATIIDGSAPADPNFGSVVIFNSGEGHDSVLEGFTITGGTGSWIVVSWEFKGAFWNRCGGGALCYNMSEPTIRKNVFRDNLAGQGGGVYIYGNPVNPADPSNPPVHVAPIITDNEFTNNSAIIAHGYMPPSDDPNNDHGDGGAIVGFQGCDAVITGNLIEQNYASLYGGGIHLRQWSNGLIENNLISDNYSSVGAGIHATYHSAPTIRGNTIQLNTANTGGGGLYIYFRSDPVIEANLITQNTAQNSSGIAVFWDSTPVIRNNVMVNNNGYVVKVEGNTTAVMIIHNTISDNSAAGIVCEWNAVPVIEHNIISGNGIGNTKGYGIYVHENALPLVRYNNVWGNGAGQYGPVFPDQTGVNGNISVPPEFVNPGDLDYHLNYDSGCINAGDPSFTGQPLIDYDGESREMGQFIDIGADEAWPVWNLTNGQEYLTIQEAINGAGYHDEIKVTPGRYLENICFNGKVVSLESIDPDEWDVVEKTVIDGNQLDSTVIFNNGEDPNTTLAGFTITGGNATTYGGGVHVSRSAVPVIRRNIIRENYSGAKGGGLYYWATIGMAVLEDNIIANNVADRSGGGVFCDSSSSVRIVNNVISGNHTVLYGGGIFIFDKRDYPSNYVFGNLIIGNESETVGGGIGCLNSVCTVVNNTIVGNKALNGAGVGTSNQEHVIANNLIAYNVQGGGICSLGDPDSSSVIFLHNNVFHNEPNDYCGAADWTGVNDNISVDPDLVNPGSWNDNGTPADPNDDIYIPGNYHLFPDSPCVDAGEPNKLPAALVWDMDREARIFGESVDIGADEIITNLSDFDTNGIVGPVDLLILMEEWLSVGDDLRSDLHPDGVIDLRDFALLADDWLWSSGWYE